MAKRPISHQLEDKSRGRFKDILPDAWILRTQTPDYGLDEQVQIVEDELVTPLLFAVQLKATEKTIKKKTFKFSTERLRDYAALSFPVMIAVYDAAKDCFYYTWAHHLRQRLNRRTAAAWLVQDSIAIPLDAPLDVQAIPAVVAEVSSFYAQLRSDGQALPVPIAFEYDTDSEAAYQQFIASLGAIGYSLRSVTRSQANLTLIFSKAGLALLHEDSKIEFPSPEENEWTSAALALLAIGLAWVSRARLSLDCLQQLVATHATLPESIEYVLSSTPLLSIAYGSGHRTSEAQLLAETLLEMGNIDFGLILGSSYVFDDRHTPQHVLKASRLLKHALALTPEDSQRATMLYSLANNCRSRGEFREALSYYFQAGRASEGYHSKNYWWAEGAGCLFKLGKYRLAERFYRKALTLPGQENVFNQVLLADTLFHQGCFRQAAQQLEDYMNQHPPTAFAVILYHVSTALAARFGEQPRDANGARQLYFAPWGPATSVADLPPERAEQALQLDPLFEPAYFTLGVQAAQRGEKREAAWHFLLAAFLNPNDIAAWLNSCTLFIGQDEEESVLSLETAVFARAYVVHGPALGTELMKSATNSGISSSKAKEGAKALVELARKCEALYPEPSATFFRIPDLQQPEENGGFWLSKDSIPDIL
ncbi:DUF4365 domain-containing protein [Hymenobacter ruricola]|uniref:DUF4365 domain-containing protein n=1 Tax=Hymenobacter ruricola TaxID=2791023 RepID=A0ABS0I347_9BACT|nr:DUF4365 domain-containing protein [Hymenobacter ruricola]MBF9221380.1 DUF4365 domain-containing protein [Hymenobacter ruricola]